MNGLAKTGLAETGRIGILVGLVAEARIARTRWPGMPIAVSGATRAGAERALVALQRAGVQGLLSFGVAAGLAPDIRAGDLVVADHVMVDDTRIMTDPVLAARFGAEGPRVRRAGLLHSDVLVTRAVDKAALFSRSGCVALDMESGLVAQSGVPFAVLRAVCDDSGCDLPPVAALAIGGGGRISPIRLMSSLLRQPRQVPALIRLARDAGRAREALM